jgi:hypothetical protein
MEGYLGHPTRKGSIRGPLLQSDAGGIRPACHTDHPAQHSQHTHIAWRAARTTEQVMVPTGWGSGDLPHTAHILVPAGPDTVSVAPTRSLAPSSTWWTKGMGPPPQLRSPRRQRRGCTHNPAFLNQLKLDAPMICSSLSGASCSLSTGSSTRLSVAVRVRCSPSSAAV